MGNNEIKDRIESLLIDKDLLPEALELFNKGFLSYESVFGTSNAKSLESIMEDILIKRKEDERLLKAKNDRDSLERNFLNDECTMIGYPDNKRCWNAGAIVYIHDKTIVEIHEYDPRSGGCVYANHKYSKFSDKKYLKNIMDSIKRNYPLSFWDKISSEADW